MATPAVQEPERYNFSRAGQIGNEKMGAISTVNDLFARNLMQSLGGWLRAPLKVKLVSGEQLQFSGFLERLSTLNYICSVRLEPLGAVGLMEFDLALAAPMRMRELMGGARFGSTLQFPPVRLRASELTSLETGMILRLPLSTHEAGELRVGGLHFARAYPVRIGDHRGALLDGDDRVEAPASQEARVG